jgi:hypothetical protein
MPGMATQAMAIKSMETPSMVTAVTATTESNSDFLTNYSNTPPIRWVLLFSEYWYGERTIFRLSKRSSNLLTGFS